MRIYIILLLIVLYFYINFYSPIEKYSLTDDIIIPSNVLENELTTNINLSIITKMNTMRLYILDNKNPIPDIYNNLPESYKNKQTYIQILYETYVDDFLDVYIVNRFNAHKFLNITYKYPSYSQFKDKYPLDTVKKSYDKIFKDLLDPSIKFLYNDITNISKKYFDFTLENIKDKEINNLKNKFDKTDSINFSNIYNSEFKKYIKKIFTQLNLLHHDPCVNNDHPFIYTFKELNDENSVEIFNSIDDIINNEIHVMIS